MKPLLESSGCNEASGNPVTLLVAGNNPFMTLRDLSARSLERGQWK